MRDEICTRQGLTRRETQRLKRARLQQRPLGSARNGGQAPQWRNDNQKLEPANSRRRLDSRLLANVDSVFDCLVITRMLKHDDRFAGGRRDETKPLCGTSRHVRAD